MEEMNEMMDAPNNRAFRRAMGKQNQDNAQNERKLYL